MHPSLDTFAMLAPELGTDNLDVTGAILPTLPIPWMCLLYPWLCGFRI